MGLATIVVIVVVGDRQATHPDCQDTHRTHQHARHPAERRSYRTRHAERCNACSDQDWFVVHLLSPICLVRSARLAIDPESLAFEIDMDCLGNRVSHGSPGTASALSGLLLLT
jgi:hypothetical protein